MTMSSINSRNDYVGNSATSVFAYTYRIFSNTDLKVTVKDLASPPNETPLAINTDYTVSGVGSASGGNVTLVNNSQAWLTAGFLTTGYKLTVRRIRPLTQNTDIRNQGDFFPEVHEDAFDHFLMVDQKQQDEIDRSVKLPETVSGVSVNPILPTPVASQLLGFDATGTKMSLYPVATPSIAANAILNSHLAQAPAFTIKGNNTGGIANETDLTVAQVNAMLGSIASIMTALYTRVVGSAAQATSGIATDSTIASAIAACISGNSILILPGTYAESPTIATKLYIVGTGENCNINGSITFASGSDYSYMGSIRTTNNITLNTGTNGIIIRDVFLASGKTFTDNGSGNLVSGIQET